MEHVVGLEGTHEAHTGSTHAHTKSFTFSHTG